jgi:hypothetical protein
VDGLTVLWSFAVCLHAQQMTSLNTGTIHIDSFLRSYSTQLLVQTSIMLSFLADDEADANL